MLYKHKRQSGKMTHSLKSARYTLVNRQRLRLKVTKSVISFDDSDLQQDDSMDTNDNDNSDTLNVQSPTIYTVDVN